MTDAPLEDGRLREELIAGCRELTRRGLTYGKSGNISRRRDERTFLVSPMGIPYDALTPENITVMDFSGRWFGPKRPSSEWRFHLDILKHRPEVGAVVHTHSTHATALACTGQGIPPFHYMVAIAGGPDVRCAPYATFGTQELSDNAIKALEGRNACLLANHGVIALGGHVGAALALAGEVENLAAQYASAVKFGTPRLLNEAEMRIVLGKFQTYGRQDTADEGLSFGGAQPV